MVDIRCCNGSYDHNAFRDLVGLEPSLHPVRDSLPPRVVDGKISKRKNDSTFSDDDSLQEA